MTGDQPVGVVPVDEFDQRQAQLLDGLEVPHPQQVFLQRTDEALGDAVAFGLAHEGRRSLDAEEGDLGLEVVRHVVGAVVVAKLQPRCHVVADRAEVAAHPLPDRLQGLEAVGALVGVDADAFAVAVVDGDEDVGYALDQGDGLAHVGAPPDVHGLGGDDTVVHSVRPLADPVRHQQTVLPHQPPHPSGRGADAGKAQSRPDLAVALAGEAALGDRLPDMLQQGGVVARSHRTGAAFRAGRCLPVPIHGCPRNAPAAGDTHQAVHPIHGGRDRPAHRLDLRRAKGAPASRRAIFSRNSSVSIVISPTVPFSRVPSSSRSSRVRSFSAASAANKARSRHSDSRAAVTSSSRATSSSGSPRSSWLTARSFRFAEKRCGGGPPADLSPPASWGRSDKSAGSVPPFSIIPSIRLSSLCGSFNRSRMSQQTLMHPTTTGDGRLITPHFGRPDGDQQWPTTKPRSALCSMEFTRAIRNKDAAGAIATLAEDVVAFDLAPPLRIGPEETRDPAWYDEWFTTWKGPIVSRTQDLEVAVGGDVGYAYGLQHMTGTKMDGEEVDLWFRSTSCFCREDGRWRITHMHNSVPFSMDGSGKALLSLRP